MSFPFSVFYSNRVEELYQRMKTELFAPDSGPFARRLVVVPSPPLKTWLMLQLAKDPEIGIAAGLEVSYPDDMIAKLTTGQAIAPRMETALAIESQLRHVIGQKLSAEQAEIWTPLLKYLHVDPFLSRKGERRLITLSTQLAALFLSYRHYGRAMVEEWEKGGKGGWQQELWRRLYPKEAPLSPQNIKGQAQLHLFSISHLSPFHLDCFALAADRMPIHYYLLSPCQAFWSDIRTDRESRRLHAFWKAKGAKEDQLETLDGYLRDCNPLLANFGRLGREMVQQLEEREVFCDEKYVLPASVLAHPAYESLTHEVCQGESKGPLTLLESVQADLLLMRTPSEKIHFDKTEESIQVHIADTRLRETEVVYDLLHHLLARHAQDEDPLRPEEILVMAPDIMEYAPLIKMVFERDKKGLDFHIMEAVAPSDHPLVQGFMHLLKLASGRWTTHELIDLLMLPAFRNRHRFTEEDVQTLKGWIRKSGVRWGQTSSHRDAVLKEKHCRSGMVEKSEVGTWAQGSERLLAGLIVNGSEEDPLVIESTQAELLGRFLELLSSLRSDLHILGRETSMTLKEWTAYLQALFDAYFDEEKEQLFAHLAAFGAAGQKMAEEKFPFATIFHHLEESLLRQRTSYRETHLHAIRFCPLLPMRTVPAKVVVLMGMQEGAFPRASTAYSLNLINSHPKADYCPTQTDFDRYLFLEAILSARNSLIMTYQGQKDNKEQAASLVIQELMAYLDRAYQIGGKAPSACSTFHHPFHSFDKRNFESEARFPSYSAHAYRLAKTYYHQDKAAPFFFISHFGAVQPAQFKETTLDIRDLGRFAKNPLKVYFNKVLGLYIPKDDEWEGVESFVLSQLDHYRIRKMAFTHNMGDILRQLECESSLPLGLFKEVARKAAETTLSEMRHNLKQLGVNETFCIELSEQVDRPKQIADGHWQMPSLHLRCQNGTLVKLVGKLEDVSSQGLVAISNKEFDKAVRIYPQLLIYDALAETGSLPLERQLIFARCGKVMPSFSDNPQKRLTDYLDYYVRGFEAPSPLLPEWVESVLKADPSSLKKKLEDSTSSSFSQTYNQELLWLMRGSKKIDTDSIVAHWKPIAQELFGNLLMNWNKK